MKINKLSILLLSLFSLVSLGYSAEDDIIKDKYDHKTKHLFYKKLKTEKPDSEKGKIKQTTQPEEIDSPIIRFPEEEEKLLQTIRDGSPNLRILIRIRDPWDFKAIPFPPLENLRTLAIYHTLQLAGQCEKEKVRALLPLLQAPNLQKIDFTVFLAEELLPHVSSLTVHASANFHQYDMNHRVMLENWNESMKERVEKFCKDKGYTVHFPEAVARPYM